MTCNLICPEERKQKDCMTKLKLSLIKASSVVIENSKLSSVKKQDKIRALWKINHFPTLWNNFMTNRHFMNQNYFVTNVMTTGSQKACKLNRFYYLIFKSSEV